MELRRKENWGDMEKGKKGFKIISLFLVFSIMIVSGAYALEFDNVKEVSTAKNALGYPTVMIKNTWGLGKDLMKIELVENTAHCSECSAVVKLDVYDDYKLPEETSKTFDLVFTNVKTDTTKALSHKFEIASGNRTGSKLGKCENKKIDCPKDTKNETEFP